MGKLETPALLIICLALLFSHHMMNAGADTIRAFHSMYAFGDSLTDTGNLLFINVTAAALVPILHPPYGETFFHKPTGRASDGRVVVDFLVKRLGAPHFLVPYLGLDNHYQGQSLVNFAVGGATAENVDYLSATYNISSYVPYSIDKQLQWFSTLPISRDKKALSEALIYFGEVGVNDYTLAFTSGFSIDVVIMQFVPNVLKVISNALEFLIESGAKYLVVEGAYPYGCTPLYTRSLFINATTDKLGCVKEVHRLKEVHNELLNQLVQNLTTKYSHDVHITFFDQSKAFTEILTHPSHYGFTNTTDPCFDTLVPNLMNVTACTDPSAYVNWDGVHFTEATHNVLLNLFFTKGFVEPYPNFLHRSKLL